MGDQTKRENKETKITLLKRSLRAQLERDVHETDGWQVKS